MRLLTKAIVGGGAVIAVSLGAGACPVVAGHRATTDLVRSEQRETALRRSVARR